MLATYKIKSYNFLLSDEKSVKFHVESNDYFGTLATVLSLWQQEKKWPENGYKEIHDDLMNLQKNYYIKKRT
jgi:hypothetical protein